MDKIKNALTKNKNPLKNYIKYPKHYKKDPKMSKRPFLSLLGSFCIIWGNLSIFLEEKNGENFNFFVIFFMVFCFSAFLI